MIHYQLRCVDAHEFDGWFRDSAAFEAQVKAGLLDCPACGSREVTRALMAPALPRKENARKDGARPENMRPENMLPENMRPENMRQEDGRPENGQEEGARKVPTVPGPLGSPAPAQVTAAGRLPAHMLAMLQKLRSEVEKNCDNVGPEFAKEARRIHRGESERRGIYGESTPDEAQALADEGIEVSPIPWVPRADG